MRPGASGGATRERGAEASPGTKRGGGDTGHVTGIEEGKLPGIEVMQIMDRHFCVGGDTHLLRAARTRIIPPESRAKNQRSQKLKDLQK